MLAGVTAESLPHMLQKLPDIGAKVPDPEGMLLSPPQRMRRAGRLFAMVLTLALLGGWLGTATYSPECSDFNRAASSGIRFSRSRDG